MIHLKYRKSTLNSLKSVFFLDSTYMMKLSSLLHFVDTCREEQRSFHSRGYANYTSQSIQDAFQS